MSAKPLRTCPECGKKSLERLIGIGAGVLFKGGGFYETDYRSESYTKAAEAEKKGADTKAETKSEAKSESKSDATSTAKTEKKPEKPAKAEPASKGKRSKKGE